MKRSLEYLWKTLRSNAASRFRCQEFLSPGSQDLNYLNHAGKAPAVQKEERKCNTDQKPPIFAKPSPIFY